MNITDLKSIYRKQWNKSLRFMVGKQKQSLNSESQSTFILPDLNKH